MHQLIIRGRLISYLFVVVDFSANSFNRSRSRRDITIPFKELVLKLFTDSKDFFFNRVDISHLGLV